MAGPVGAGLVPAGVWASNGFGAGSTGDHKGRPYGAVVVAGLVGAGLVPARVWASNGVSTGNAGDHKDRPYGAVVVAGLVGAGLVPARVWASNGVGTSSTGDHKGRPYGAVVVAGPVGAGLVPARVWATDGLGTGGTGDHKGRPYGMRVYAAPNRSVETMRMRAKLGKRLRGGCRRASKGLLVAFVVGFAACGIAAPPIEHFTGHARYEQARISPTAKYLAVTTRQDDYEYLVVIGLANREVAYRTHFGKGWNVQDFHWATAERILVQPARRIVGRTDFSFPTGELYALNADGTDASVLFGMNAGFGKLSARAGRNEGRLEAAEILHLLPDEPEHVLIGTVPFGVNKVGRARRINIHTGQTEPVVVGHHSNSRFLADHDGRVRFEYGSNVENVMEVFHFPEGSPGTSPDEGEPILVSSGRINEGVTMPLADAGDGWYALDNTETSTTQLIHWQPTTGNKQTLVHNSAVDIGEGLFDPDGQLIAARISEHYPDYHYVQPDAALAKTHRRIRAAFPNEDVAFTSITDDGAQGVAVVYGDRFPSTFYLVDFRTEEVEELFQSRPWLKREDLSLMESVQLKTRDGTVVHGYLTTPSGWREGDRLPLIVLVHGGPHGVRDVWGFDPEAQLFASRGFAVLQVNFRGSGGYGKDFLYAGFGRWGREMQDDVTDATRWAVAAGFADPERLCIYGGSYGGYAALTGAFREPDLYRCAVGYVGVYDLEMMYRKGDIPDRRAGLNYLRDAIGEDRDELRARSPVHNADRIRAAVMLVHGALDQRVPIAHATSLRRALKAAGNPVEVWHVERKEGHGFGNPDNRKEMYGRMLTFFDQHIGRGRDLTADAGD